MELPHEVEVWYVIPALRRELAKNLIELGLTQKEIAKKLNLTEPAVSQYLSGKRGKDINFSTPVLSQIKISAKKIKSSTAKNTVSGEIVRITNYIRKTCLCNIHKGLDKGRKNCCVCKK